MPSPYPGVSTTVRRSFTPRSSISTVEVSIFTVLFTTSVVISDHDITTGEGEIVDKRFASLTF